MKSPVEFWQWFAAHHHRYEHLDGPDRDVRLDEAIAVLHQVCDGLWLQFGGGPQGPHELVISAEGNVDYFADVQDLVAVAPAIPGWHIIAFKPARGFDFTTSYNGVSVTPASAWFLPLQSPSRPDELGLRIAVPGFDAAWSEEFLYACYIVLDAGLGELRAAQEVQHVEVCAVPASPEEAGYIALAELGGYLDWRAGQRAQ